MNIHPVGAIFWIAVLAWVVWKVKLYLDNQAFAKRMHEEAKAEYASLNPKEKQAADWRAKNSIKLRSDSESESQDTTANGIVIIMVVIALLIIF